MDLSGVGVWSQQLRYSDPGEAAEAAAELEELGFSALWIPDMGGDTFEAAERLLAATRSTVVATGVLNLWYCPAEQAAASYAALAAKHDDRLLLGIGVSHAIAVDSAAEPGRYQRPLTAMKTYLDGLDAAEQPVPQDSRVLAALGPRMLELASRRARGVHPYLVTPEHTRIAREAVGDGPLVLPEQAVVLCSDKEEAQAIAGGWLRGYLSLPNYANSLIRLGFEPDEVAAADGRVFDAMIAWGDEAAVRRRVEEHRAAGADHVTLQVLTADQTAFPREEWRRLAAALL
ncbi:LLM class F420-dependent oxidoreductase [Frankia sp. CcI49]|uniref:TIGR03620 family F420-dependent LLM class oxidoreductase n=1 Tax=Frankia sp. CcI49 TaxID=1745382 RepID=UPI0009763882|nr:TIGR03620 family F420-dependent LLM class oxidoreductase [Frankia sp. CcI49]ONH58833.1 LLM class F420-dependent oxidoreductase [Frankia sp. CcI49]